MKKFLRSLTTFAFAAGLLMACGEEEQPIGSVSISGVPPTAVIEAGETVGPVSVSISASDGLASVVVRKDGATIETLNFDGETSASHEFSYTSTEEDANSNLVFEFVATDSNGNTQTATHVLTVGEIATTIRIEENIEADAVWETGKAYILGGRITVTNGATLTIEPGVIVKGEAGSGPNATALVIARGARINAAGEADQPIIFTSVADEIEPGMVASPNLDPDIEGLWGGLIVLGRAPSSFAGDVSEVQIEGIPPSDTNGLYGGDDPEDDSGVLRYISIRHGGSNIGEGNEINGLTLGGVGSATVVENIEVVANQDDGIEWFGGTVSVTNAIIWNSGDDALDTDQAWAGTMDNFILLCGPNTDHAMEVDGPEGSFNAAHTLTNGTVVGNDVAELGDFRDGARGTFKNIYFFGFSDPAETEGRGDLSLSGDLSLANFENGILNFENLEATLAEGVTLETVFRNGTHEHASQVALGENTVGADKSAFAGWSWAAEAGQLDEL
ncbi:hypothetical protein SAMN04488057_101417 [Cyclobacterium lianum]|uniref:Right handed beta helix region n=1 Tax=Cyclobacterium lianum TaxID=388280 RepID=A0A1M7IPK8_9BACT|nr:hypothetical protein [Cyclobacterium lianum]SHM42660.1 hypothetical protein SAMN04488057_101417 [Cyclobacterium lianum]